MGKSFRLFKIFKKKKKQDGNFLIKEDIKSIDHLLVKRHKTVKEIENIDQKIILIQKSTKTTVPQLRPLHDTLRQKYKWYYNWHLQPYSRATHFLILGVYLFALTIFSANYFSTPKPVLAFNSCVSAVVSGYWSVPATWGVSCGGTAPQPGDNVTITNGKTVTLDADTNDLQNITIDSGGVLNAVSYTIMITGNWMNNGTFNAGTGTVTFNGTAGTINPGASSFYNLTFNNAGGEWSPAKNATLTITNDLTMTAGTLDDNMAVSDGCVVNGNISGTNGIINFGGDFIQRVSSAKSFGATSGSADWNIGNLYFENSSGSDRTITTNTGSTGHIIIGKLKIGNASDTNKTVLDNETNDRIIESSMFNITSKGTFQASSTASLTVYGAWTNNGTFTAGIGTVTFVSSVYIYSSTNFYNLTLTNNSATGISFNLALTVTNTLFSHNAGSKLTFAGGVTHSIGRLDLLGGAGDVGNTLKLRSTSPGQGYNLAISNITADYLDLQDARNTGSIISIAHARDSGGNANFYLTDSYGLTASTLEKAGVGWAETVTARDFYGGTAVSDSATTFDVSSSSENIKFYTDNTYETQTNSYTLSSGVATIYLKASNTKDEEITYTITDSHGKVVTSDVISVAGNPLVDNPLADNHLKLVASPKMTDDQVPPTLSALPTKKQETTAETAAKVLVPVAQAMALVGLIPLILQILQAIPSAAPLASSVFPLLFTTASVRRRKKPWGNVFDSLTGHPVDLAVVRLYEKSTSKLVSTQVTDFDGRFHFLAGTGTYYIQVRKKGYEFPARISKFKASQLSSRFGKDSDIYLGVPFTIQNQNAQINLNIPIDPVLEKLTNNIRFRKSLKESFEWFLIGISYIAFPLMLIGAAIAALSTVVIASKVNFVTDVVYFFLLSGFLVTSRIRQNRLGQVFDSENKKPIIGAMVTVFDQEYNAIRQTQTTDKNGNFSILAQKGAYYIIIEKDGYKFPSTKTESTKKQPIYTGGIINKTKTGFIGVDVPMDKK